MKKRKIPLRKCMITGEMKPKQELVRVVRTPEGEIAVDLTGKLNGRGAYVSNDDECFERAKQQDIFSKHFQTKVSDEVYDQLKAAKNRGRK